LLREERPRNDICKKGGKNLPGGLYPQGEVITFTLEDLVDLTSGRTTAAHDTSLKTALATGRQLGADLPEDRDIHVVAIESQHVYEIQEGLTPTAAAAVPLAVRKTLDLLEMLLAD
jgi:Ni,Fe-hydrogenase maturation factor